MLLNMFQQILKVYILNELFIKEGSEIHLDIYSFGIVQIWIDFFNTNTLCSIIY